MRLIGAALLVVALGGAAWAADQTQSGEKFTRNQVSAETGLPEVVDPLKGVGVKWKAKLGSETYAIPTVAEGRVLIGANNANPRDPRHTGDRGILYCFDEKTGDFVWQLVSPKIEGDNYKDWPNIGITSCPTVEKGKVYTATNRAEVVCLDLLGMANGNDGPFKDESKHQMPSNKPVVEVGPKDADIIWLTDLVATMGIYQHDTTNISPLVVGDFIYINSCNGVDMTHKKIRKPDAPSLVVLEKKTGRVVAKDVEHMGPQVIHATWSSPAIGDVNGKQMVFFGGGNGILYGFEPLKAMPAEGTVVDLKSVWKYDPDPTGPKEESVDHKYTSNRETSQSNILTNPVLFDHRVFLTAGGDFWWGKRKAWLKCIDPAKEGNPTETATVWSHEMHGCLSTPAVTKEITVVCDPIMRTIECLDTTDGKLLWSHKTKGDTWGSALIADGKIYVGTMQSEFFVFAASKEKKLLCETKFDAPIGNNIVAANGVIYVTTHKTIWALAK